MPRNKSTKSGISKELLDGLEPNFRNYPQQKKAFKNLYGNTQGVSIGNDIDKDAFRAYLSKDSQYAELEKQEAEILKNLTGQNYKHRWALRDELNKRYEEVRKEYKSLHWN